MTTLTKLPPHLTTAEGRADATDVVRAFAADEFITAAVTIDPRSQLGYVSVQLLDYAALGQWVSALKAHGDFHIADMKAHGEVANEAWGWIGGHHVNLWFCGASWGAA